jgi:hypothetical protein
MIDKFPFFQRTEKVKRLARPLKVKSAGSAKIFDGALGKFP